VETLTWSKENSQDAKLLVKELEGKEDEKLSGKQSAKRPTSNVQRPISNEEAGEVEELRRGEEN
jgi:hypothetical protein